MTPISNGTRLRKDHNTFSAVITSYDPPAFIQGSELWIAPADGNEVKANDKWLKVTHVNGEAVSAGWMAYIHKGVPICKNLMEQPQPPQPPPPEPPKFPLSFTLVYPSGAKAEYKFVKVIE